ASFAMVPPGAAMAQLPTVERQGDVAYLTGGVGTQERAALEELAAREGMTLKLEFAEPEGAFVSAVEVTITSAAGEELLRVRTDGPWLFAKLPAGEYQVRTKYRDMERQAKVTVRETGTQKQT